MTAVDRLSRQNSSNDAQERARPALPKRLQRPGISPCALLACMLSTWGCANRGMQPPHFDFIDSGVAIDMNEGSGGGGASGTGGASGPGQAGAGGAGQGRGGTGGAGGGDLGGAAGLTGSGGQSGAGGTTGAGGVAGTGGAAGTKGTGGAGGGGTTGAGGKAGAGGIAGAGGAAGSAAGAGGVSGTGGNAGAHGGAGGFMCPLGGNLDCSSAGALTLPGGKVTDFSTSQWNSTTSQWCDANGLRGHLFAFAGASSTAAATVDTSAQNLKLSLTVGKTDYAGGGVTFESCVNASAFTSVQFTASVTSGSLTGCVWQIQLQTQDQRMTTGTDPTGGTCSSNCEAYPVVANLAAPGTTASTYTEAFTAFTNQTGSTIPMATQLAGVQWQVDSGNSGSGTCTVELRIDDVVFK